MTVSASKYDVKANYFYETEAWATEALLRHFPVAGLNVWEPAAGNHKMVDVLRAGGASRVWSSDIIRYDRDHDEIFDFLKDPYASGHFDFGAIITNPPYGKGNRDAVRFIQNALDVCSGMVAMLLTAKFDFGSTRMHLFRDNPRFVAKINLIDRISWEGNGKTGTEDHAWYCWGPPTVLRHLPVILYAGKKVSA